MAPVLAFAATSWRPARPRRLIEIAAARLDARHGMASEICDLMDAGPGIAAFRRDDMDARARALIARIEAAPALIIGCPVFQGGYPGLFKHLFDQIPPGALKGRPVLITACGGGLRHALVVEHQLRPLFGFFEALTMPTAVYACAPEIGEDGSLAEALGQRLDTGLDQLAQSLRENRCAA